MKPSDLGEKYNRIAHWWHQQHNKSSYGVDQLKRAVGYCAHPGKVLDVGCGAGGRFVRLLGDRGFTYTGIDVSDEMVKLARDNHPEYYFVHGDICEWQGVAQFDFILAWDSIFHLPLSMQKPVIGKLCGLLKQDGILLYTFGNAEGEHTDQWCNDSFYYSSIGINENLQTLIQNDMVVLHLELDQYPLTHAYTIAKKQ